MISQQGLYLVLVIFIFSSEKISSTAIGLVSLNPEHEHIVDKARTWMSTLEQNNHYSYAKFNSSMSLESWVSTKAEIEERGLSVFLQFGQINAQVTCMLSSLNTVIVSPYHHSPCGASMKSVSLDFNPSFKVQIIRQLMNELKWKDVIVLFDYEHREAFSALQTNFGSLFSIVGVFVSTKVNGTASVLTYLTFKSVALRSDSTQATIMMLTSTNINRAFDMLEKELAELKGVVSNVVLYEPMTYTEFQVSGDYTVIGFMFQVRENDLKSSEEVLFHDSAMVAFSLAREIEGEKNCTNNCLSKGISCYTCKENNTNKLSSFLSKIAFPGISGTVSFQERNSRSPIPLDIVNLKDNTFKKVGFVSASQQISITGNITRNELQSLFTVSLQREIVVSTLKSAPFVMERVVNNATVRYGFLIDILNAASRLQNFSYRISYTRVPEYGRFKNGSWTGMIGDVLYQRADIAVAALTVTSQRRQVVDFIPYMELEIVYNKMHESSEQVALLEFLQPFSLSAWLCFLTAIILVGTTTFILENIKTKTVTDHGDFVSATASKRLYLSTAIWFAVTSSLRQSCDTKPKSSGGRILIGFFWFIMMIIISLYTANMAAFYTSKRARKDVTELEEFLKLNYSFSVVNTSALDQLLALSENQIYKMIHEKIVSENTYVKSSTVGVKNTILKKKYIYIGEEPFVRKRMKPPYCQTYLVKGIMPPKSFGFAVRKNSPLKQPLSIAIAQLVESGFIAERYYYWFDVYNKNGYCNNVYWNKIDDHRSNRIDLVSVVGMTMTTALGLFMAIFALPIEHFWQKKLEGKMAYLRSVLPGVGKKAFVVSALEENVRQRDFKKYYIGSNDNELSPQDDSETKEKKHSCRDLLSVSEFMVFQKEMDETPQ